MGGKGSGGHNRKSAAVKKAEGNRGKRKLARQEPTEEPKAEPIPGEPKMPACLTTAGRLVWPMIVAELADNGALFQTDGIAIAALCSSLVLFTAADAAIAKFGSVCATLDEITGVAVLKTNPAVRVRSDALRHLSRSLQSFGLDPASRSGIQLPDPKGKKKSALDAILHAKSNQDDVVN
jgi:P27 family predicted phage terminase small subunit